MKLGILAAIALVLSVLVPAISSAQVTTGTPPFGSFGGGPDVINLGNLNVHLDVPVFQKPGRGMDFSYDLTFDDSVWLPVSSTGTAVWTPVFNWGWAAQTQITTGFIAYTKLTADCDTPPPIHQYITYTTFVYHDTFGGIHPFSGSLVYDPTSCNGNIATLNAVSKDGSGLILNAGLNGTPAPAIHTITTRNGQITNPPVNLTTGYSGTTATATDRNGNQISVSSTTNTAAYTDTTGATALSVSGSATPASPLVLSYTAPSGAAAKYTISYKSYTVATKFGCSATDYGPTANNLVDTITLPDGSTYAFTYEPTPTLPSDVTGRLASVQLPTGGTIIYTYSGGSSGHINCTDGSNSGLTRKTPDSATAWTYTRAAGTGAAYTTTVTDPVPNTTVIQFQGIYETQRKTYQGTTSGTLLQTINTCYNGAAPPCTSSAVSLPITQRDSIFGTKIVFWKFNEYETETVDGETENRTSAFLRYYTVFNLEQTEGLKALLALPSARPIESAEAIVAAMPNPPAYQQGFLACYSPSNDTVTMPSPTAFHSRAEHYSTMFHELTHATGHAKRLAREGFDRHVEFGSESYSREELVAEMGSAMLCGVAGIEQATLANSAAYLKSSIARLKSDSRLVISAASAAQKASDYIRGESAKDSPAVAGMHQPADNLIAKTVSHHQ